MWKNDAERFSIWHLNLAGCSTNDGIIDSNKTLQDINRLVDLLLKCRAIKHEINQSFENNRIDYWEKM